MNVSASPGVPSARREELRALLLECEVGSDEPLCDETPLVSSGLLDSLALFRVALWVEAQIGKPVDPSTFDLAQEWDSIEAIVEFIDRAATGRKPEPSPRRVDRTVPHPSRIIRYTPEYKHAVAELQTNLWCADLQRNLQYFEWKYERNPCAGPSLILLAIDGDDVIGMRGFHSSRWESDCFAGHPLVVADDSVVRPDHRNRGVTNQIMHEAMNTLSAQGVAYVFNFSGSPVTVLNSLAMGWRSIGEVEPVRRRSRAARLRAGVRYSIESLPLVWRFASSAAAFSRIEYNPFLRINRQLETTMVVRGRRITISRLPRPQEMALLIHATHHDGRIRLVRDAAYLKWRFENPLHEYRFFYLEGERLEGYLVVKRSAASDEPSPVVHIVDLEARDDESRTALIESASASNLFDSIVVWSATLPTSCSELLATLDYEPIAPSTALQGHPCMLVRSTDDAQLMDAWHLQGVSLTDFESWDMRMLYSMAG
jgi:GNAT superfamily N-acetyltransferase